MKILHLPSSVGGNAWGLSQGERRIGLESKVLVSYDDWLNYDADIKLHLPVDGKINKVVSLLKLAKAFIKIRKAFDIYHFNFGTSLLDFPFYGITLADLPYYHKGSKIFVTFNGCDARLKYPTMERTRISPCHYNDCYNGLCNSGKFDEIRKKRIAKFTEYAEHMFAVNPDLMWFLPREKSSFLPYTIANWFEIERTTPDFEKRSLNIVHSPTNRIIKGSGIILSALEKLKRKYGEAINIELVENTPHKEALKIYKRADLVIDQILAGWYGGFAVETMKMGKPVIAYIREEDLIYIPSQMKDDLKNSVINANPENIEEVLDKCINDRSNLKERAINGYDYVNTWHDPVSIAKTVKEYYES
jgi:hypothetical protein